LRADDGVRKVDVLPDGATDLRLRQWLKRRAEGMSLFPTGVHVTSSNTGHGIYDLVQDLAGRSENFKKDVFLCGRTNVGKSSLLNKMIRM
jgi:ribosome biogenesis GTPase A